MDFYESQARMQGFTFVAGVDEAGRGPLAGPVAAAAVIFPENYRNREIRDSKKLSASKREELFDIIIVDALSVGLAFVEPSVIDRINILKASLLAMKKAVLNLDFPPDFLLVDGLNTIDVPFPQKPIVKGDDLSISVAAASIIAKVSRDHLMNRYHVQYSQYNFVRNKGYATTEHREAISKYGTCKIHRKSFKIKFGT
ncbi:MAG: ribonuclease HII [Syntrophales bacterium]|jgi:ribonuclease HII|nr:ribonuclease HII [Syntrophales bacterium]MDY0044565.1 ribonuclease HII [Syntrophales bacterium]